MALGGLVEGVGQAPAHLLHREVLQLELLVHVPHVDELEVELLHRPDLAPLGLALDQDGRLAYESSALFPKKISLVNIFFADFFLHILTLVFLSQL